MEHFLQVRTLKNLQRLAAKMFANFYGSKGKKLIWNTLFFWFSKKDWPDLRTCIVQELCMFVGDRNLSIPFYSLKLILIKSFQYF